MEGAGCALRGVRRDLLVYRGVLVGGRGCDGALWWVARPGVELSHRILTHWHEPLSVSARGSTEKVSPSEHGGVHWRTRRRMGFYSDHAPMSSSDFTFMLEQQGVCGCG